MIGAARLKKSSFFNKLKWLSESKKGTKLIQQSNLTTQFSNKKKVNLKSIKQLHLLVRTINCFFNSIKLTGFLIQNQQFNLINCNQHYRFSRQFNNQKFKINKMAPNNSTNQSIQDNIKSQSKTSSEKQNIDDEIICKFGALTDAQFCNLDDRPAWYNKNKTRYYRSALIHLKKAFDNWNAMDVKPTFVLQLGDLIDGLNSEEIGCNSLVALEETSKIFEEYSNLPIFHAVGNHELYNFSRSDIALLFRESLIKRGRLQPDLVHLQLDFHDLDDENTLLYYKFQPKEGLKVIALDCFDISVIGHHKDSEKYKEAAKILYEKNHTNFDLWDFDNHLEGLNKRFQTQNGGFSQNQLNWLRNELKESEKNDEKVIVFGHTGLHPESSDPSCLAYNYEKVLEIFNEVNCVIAYLSGHAHQSGYARDKNGIHYIVLHGIIETCPNQDAYSTITIKKDKLIVDGKGSEQSMILPIRPIKINKDNKSNSEKTETDLNESLSGNSKAKIDESNDKYNEYVEQLPASVVEVSV